MKQQNKKLNLGCGFDYKKGYINFDISDKVGADVVGNMLESWPFPSNYFDEIFTHDTLIHIPPCKWDFVLKEINRVSKKGCILDFTEPFDNIIYRSAVSNYTTFTWNSFSCMEVGGHSIREYYSPLKLKRLSKKPNKFVMGFFCMFPLFLKHIHLKFEVIK